jgi:hypothetical protein
LPFFADAEELYRFVGRLLRDLSDDPELGPLFRKANTIVQYRTTNPDAVITAKLLDGESGQVDFGETELQPQVTMWMEADQAHLFWLGKVRPTLALAKGDMQARGPVAKILKLVPLARSGFDRYVKMLEDAGREDLLEPVRGASDPPAPRPGTPPQVA